MAQELLVASTARRILIQTDSEQVLYGIGKGSISYQKAQLQEWLRRILDTKAQLERIGIRVEFSWVKGHHESAGNNIADVLAGFASRKSAAGYKGHIWDNPHADELALSRQSFTAVSKAAQKVKDRPFRQAKEELRRRKIEEQMTRLQEARAHKRLMKQRARDRLTSQQNAEGAAPAWRQALSQSASMAGQPSLLGSSVPAGDQLRRSHRLAGQPAYPARSFGAVGSATNPVRID